MRMILATLVVALLAVPVVLSDEAQASGCPPMPLEESLDQATVAFIGEQIHENADGRQTFRVDRPIKGDIDGTAIEAHRDPEFGRTWLDRGQIVFVGGYDEAGLFRPGCASGAHPLEALLLLDGRLTPPAGGSPGFVVAVHRLPGIVGVVLNPLGEVIHYAAGEREIHQFAVCPGDQVVATLAADRSDPFDGTSLPADTIELRDSQDLSVIETWPIDITIRSDSGLPGLIDLECHAPDGSLVTAIAPRRFTSDQLSSAVPVAGDVLVVRDGTIEPHAMDWPRDATYDPVTDTLHVVADEAGRTITSIAVDGTATTWQLPGTHLAWDMTVHDGAWSIVTEDIDIDSSNRRAGIVSHLLTGPIDSLDSHRLPLVTAHGTSGGIHETPLARWLHLHDGTAFGLLVDLADPDRAVAIDTQWFHSIAIGDHVTLVSASVLTPDGLCAIPGLINGGAMAAIRPVSPIVYEAPPGTEPASIPVTTTIPGGGRAAAGAYPTAPVPGQSDDSCPSAPTVEPALIDAQAAAPGESSAAAPTTSEDTTSGGSAAPDTNDGPSSAALGAAIVAVLAGAVLVFRRRR